MLQRASNTVKIAKVRWRVVARVTDREFAMAIHESRLFGRGLKDSDGCVNNLRDGLVGDASGG